MKVLILGATGYVGRRLVKALVSKGHEVIALVRSMDIELCECVRCYTTEDFKSALIENKDITTLVNVAGVYEKNGIDIDNILDGNLTFPLKVMLYTRDTKINKIVNVATSLPENLNLYTISKKKLSEFGQWIVDYYSNHDMCFFNVLLENFYGEGEPENRFLSYVTKSLIEGTDIDMTTGEQKRDFIYISDVIDGLVHLIEKDAQKGYAEVDLGTGVAPSVREIVEYLHKVSCSESKINFGAVPKRKMEPDSVADIENMKKFGIFPKIGWKDGMKKLVAYRKEIQ